MPHLFTYDNLGAADPIMQHGETIFLQPSISSTQTFPPMQSLSAVHGPKSAAQGPLGQGSIILICGAPEVESKLHYVLNSR